MFYKNTSILKQFLLGLIILISFSCTFNNSIGVYDKTSFFDHQTWNASNRISFTFSTIDTTSRYNIYIILRHTDSYKYNNIWLDVSTIAQGDSAQTQQVNLKLGDNNKWLGSAMDDVIEHQILITHAPVKLKQGNYTFILQQIMREDALHDVLNAGIRIERVN
jgi:gliding motility-associated lipoprotein GldH